MSGKPTKAQAEVLRRMADGWVLDYPTSRLIRTIRLRKNGQPSITVRRASFDAAITNGWIFTRGRGYPERTYRITNAGRAAIVGYEKEHAHEQ